MVKTILTAGDIDLMPMFTSLKADGVSLVSTLSGRHCLSRLRNLTPDLIILDERLPDSRGSDICSRIKQVSRLRAVPLLMLIPQQNSDRLETEAALIGADAALVQPFSGEMLRAKVAELLGGSLHAAAHVASSRRPWAAG